MSYYQLQVSQNVLGKLLIFAYVKLVMLLMKLKNTIYDEKSKKPQLR
jgi:hypothetical protein